VPEIEKAIADFLSCNADSAQAISIIEDSFVLSEHCKGKPIEYLKTLQKKGQCLDTQISTAIAFFETFSCNKTSSVCKCFDHQTTLDILKGHI
jgi:hypothetical protein